MNMIKMKMTTIRQMEHDVMLLTPRLRALIKTKNRSVRTVDSIFLQNTVRAFNSVLFLFDTNLLYMNNCRLMKYDFSQMQFKRSCLGGIRIKRRAFYS